jgi:hypothetical protein
MTLLGDVPPFAPGYNKTVGNNSHKNKKIKIKENYLQEQK